MERASALLFAALFALLVVGMAGFAGAAGAHDRAVGASYDQVSLDNVSLDNDQAGAVVVDDDDDCQAAKPTRCSRTNVAHAIPVGEAPRASQLPAGWNGTWPHDLSLVGLILAPEPTPPRAV